LHLRAAAAAAAAEAETPGMLLLEEEAAQAAAAAAAAEAAAAPQPVAELRLAELAAATDAFAAARRIGEGAFGVVFQAASLPSLPGAGEVAIKRLRTVGGAGEEQLHTELAALSECRHENLLPIIGCCLDRRGLCLVTPLRRSGNLEDRLLRTPEGLHRLERLGWTAAPAPLGWHARLRIVRDATRGLVYLHRRTDAKRHVLHRDVKARYLLPPSIALLSSVSLL